MGGGVRKLTSAANKAFWKDAEQIAALVRSWPDWKRAGINVTDRRIVPKTQNLHLTRGFAGSSSDARMPVPGCDVGE